MPKWAYVDQGVQGLNIYQAGKMQGNPQMMQQGLDLVSKSADALRGITGVQQARQQMELARAAEGRTQQLFPLQIQAQRQATEMGQIDLEKQRRQEQEYARITAQAGRSPGELELLAKMKGWGVDAAEAEQTLGRMAMEQKAGLPREKVAADVAAERQRRAEAITGAARAEAERPYVAEAAAAAGTRAEYEKLSGAAAIRQLPTKELVDWATLKMQEADARAKTAMSLDELWNFASDAAERRRMLRAQRHLVEQQGDLAGARAIDIAIQQELDSPSVQAFEKAAPWIKEYRQVIGAIAAARKSGNPEDFANQAGTLSTPQGLEIMNLILRARPSMKDLEDAYMNYQNSILSILHEYGIRYDVGTGRFLYAGPPTREPYTMQEYGVLKERPKDLEGSLIPYPTGPGQPAGEGPESDIDTILQYLEQ